MEPHTNADGEGGGCNNHQDMLHRTGSRLDRDAKTVQFSMENLSMEIFSRISNDWKRKSAAFEREKSYL